MIWSVSMLLVGRTTVREWMVFTAGMLVRSEFARVGDAATNGRSGGGFGTGEQGARTHALSPLEIAIAGADGVVPRRHEVAIHSEAHRAAALAPFGTGVEEHAMEAFGLGSALDVLRSRDHEHLHALGELVTAQHPRGVAQVGEPSIRAAADEHIVHRHILNRLAGLEPHVVERPLKHRIALC